MWYKTIRKFKEFRVLLIGALFVCSFVQLSGQTNIEQDRVKRTNRTAQDVRSVNNLRPIKQLRIPENLIRIQKISVPDLLGRRFETNEIAAYLKQLGLQLGRVVTVSSPEDGIIVRQIPAAGTTVDPRTAINLSVGVANRTNLVTVPQYVKLTIDRAVARMPNDRLTAGNITEVNSPEPAGIVVSQFPEQGMQVDENTPVNLDVSNGVAIIEKTRVPQLKGFSLDDAALKLKNADLFAGRITARPSNENTGIVIAQNPPAGTEVDRKTAVDIVYSQKIQAETVIVPNVVGMDRVQAILLLKEKGLNYAQEFVREKGYNTNVVISQSIPPGQRVELETTVFIRVQNEAAVPPWIGWTAGMVIVASAGMFIRKRVRKSGKRKNKAIKKSKIELKPVWDVGNQTLKVENELSKYKIEFKYVSDFGEQKII